jgi:uncharacterized protein (TIGR03067 family)
MKCCRWIIAGLAGVFLVSTASYSQEPANPDKFDGRWQILQQITDGKELSAEELKNRYLVFRGDKVTQFYLDKERGTAKAKIDGTKNPKHIEFHYLDGPAKGVVLQGIYQIDGDTFTICLSGIDRERPTAFASKPDSGTILLKLRRVPEQ